jgi:hypothetical protein
MIAFAFVDGDGHPVGGGIGPTLPPGAVGLTAPFTTLDLPVLRWRNGVWEQRTDIPPPPVPSAEEIAAEVQSRFLHAKREAVAQANSLAGVVRARFVTVIPAQDMVYLRKEAEARRYLADPAPDLADYPYVAAEIGITGADGEQVAQVYTNLAVILDAAASQLETARLGTIASIEAATTEAAIAAALAAYQAALEAFG